MKPLQLVAHVTVRKLASGVAKLSGRHGWIILPVTTQDYPRITLGGIPAGVI